MVEGRHVNRKTSSELDLISGGVDGLLLEPKSPAKDVALADDVTSATVVASSSSPLNEVMTNDLFKTIPRWLQAALSNVDWTNRGNDALIVRHDEDLGRLAVLPEDVLDNILARIPYKKLFQLKCLTKGWDFRIMSRIKKKTQKMVLIPSFPLHSINLSNNSLVSQLAIRNSHRHIVIGSLVNTVLMVDGYSSTPFIYFPSNRSIIKLPRQPPPSTYEIESLLDCNTYGLGYGEPVCDAKVIVISRWRGHREMYSQSYSTLNEVWTPISFKERPITILSLAGTFVPITQKLHWIAQNNELNTYMVLCLDLKTMVFEEILLGAGVPFDTLGTMSGLLCTLVFVELDSKRGSGEESIEKKQGFYELRILYVDSKWMIVHRCSSLLDEERYGEFYVLGFLDHGAILIKAMNKKTKAFTVLIYDIQQRSCVEVKTPTNLLIGNTHASEYVAGISALSQHL